MTVRMPAWHRPMRGRDAAEPHRASTPLELLVDLCFVVAVAQAGLALHHELADGHFVEGIVPFLMVFFAICGTGRPGHGSRGGGARRDQRVAEQRASWEYAQPPQRRAGPVTETDHGTRKADLPRLDFLYVPSSDVAADLAAFVDGLGASVAFAIDGMGTRVAMLELGDGPPILLAGHLAGERAILVYAVDDLDSAVARAVAAGFDEEQRVELPPGPAVTLARKGHRVALYAPIRPGVVESFRGRRDF